MTGGPPTWWGFGVCIARLEESGYYRYALYDRDVEQTEPIRIGFCATLEHAKTAVEHVVGLYLMSADG